MLPVDLEQFWKDDDASHGQNCFDKNAPQVAMGIRMSDECVFAELNEEGNPWDIRPVSAELNSTNAIMTRLADRRAQAAAGEFPDTGSALPGIPADRRGIWR